MKHAMLKSLLAVVCVLSFCTAAAQTDTIWEKSPRWHISEWYTQYIGGCNYDDQTPPVWIWDVNLGDTHDVAKEQFSANPIAVKGIAVMISMNRRDIDGPQIWDPLFTAGSPKLPEYVMLANYDSINDSMILFSDSLRWDTAAKKILWVKQCGVEDWDTFPCCRHDVYVHEAFFPKGPVIADSSFYIVATQKCNTYLDDNHQYSNPHWHPYEPTLYVGIGDWHVRHQVRMREYEKWPNGWDLTASYVNGVFEGHYYGGFFPIVDYYNLEARPEEACDSMGTVTGSGRFTDYVPCPITAVPAPGYWFRQWNDGDTTNPRTVFLTQDTLFTATFTASLPCRADALTQDSTHGTVTGSGNYFQGDTVTFTAHPNTGYTLLQWSDGSTRNPYRFTITRDTTVTAIFRQLGHYRVDAEPADHTRGFVTGGGNYWELDTVTLNAVARPGNNFLHWNDSVTDNPRTIVVMQDTAFTAYFEPIQHEGIAAPDGRRPLFTLTPNPARNSVTVTINSQLSILNSQFSIALTDAAGRELLTLKVQQPKTTIPLGQYPAGTFFVTLRTPYATSTQRLVIE